MWTRITSSDLFRHDKQYQDECIIVNTIRGARARFAVSITSDAVSQGRLAIPL